MLPERELSPEELNVRARAGAYHELLRQAVESEIPSRSLDQLLAEYAKDKASGVLGVHNQELEAFFQKYGIQVPTVEPPALPQQKKHTRRNFLIGAGSMGGSVALFAGGFWKLVNHVEASDTAWDRDHLLDVAPTIPSTSGWTARYFSKDEKASYEAIDSDNKGATHDFGDQLIINGEKTSITIEARNHHFQGVTSSMPMIRVHQTDEIGSDIHRDYVLYPRRKDNVDIRAVIFENKTEGKQYPIQIVNKNSYNYKITVLRQK